MKFCPNCQSKYADDSLQFCLQCGTFLSSATTPLQKSNNATIVIAGLSVFALITIVVGGLGIFYFFRSDEKKINVSTKREPVDLANEESEENRNLSNAPSVERLSGNQVSKSINGANTNASKSLIMSQVIVSASSVRRPEKANFYFPNFAFDNNSSTAWCEGREGAGAGEWLQFEFNHRVTLKQIKIEPGYFKNSDVWAKNNRAARINVQFSDGSEQEFDLSDGMQTQTLDVGRATTKSVKITILDFFKGAADSDDTLISEVSFVTE
jgi:hypothetical protein